MAVLPKWPHAHVYTEKVAYKTKKGPTTCIFLVCHRGIQDDGPYTPPEVLCATSLAL